MIIFDKEYDDGSLNDLERDVMEAFDPDFNSRLPIPLPPSDTKYRVMIYLNPKPQQALQK